MDKRTSLTVLFLLWLITACRTPADRLPTRIAIAPTVPPPTVTPSHTPTVPPTWTAAPTIPATVTSPPPTWTPRPSATPWPTATATVPTATPTRPPATVTATGRPAATTTQPTPTPSPLPAASGPNLLPNPSFEEGWYHPGGIPELQIPNGWLFEWDEGQNPLDPDPWNVFVRPECRLLSPDFLPPNEHALFIWDGQYTVKCFKGMGAISFRLLTDVYLEAGTYTLEINVFPDLVDGYTAGGEKIWAPDPLSGDVRFIVGQSDNPWILPGFGRKNTLTHTFTITQAGTVRLGVAVRGRWAIQNNGWFLDDWSLKWHG